MSQRRTLWEQTDLDGDRAYLRKDKTGLLVGCQAACEDSPAECFLSDGEGLALALLRHLDCLGELSEATRLALWELSA